MITKKNPIDMILDPQNNDNVVLYDEKDIGIEFEQVCLVPINNEIYCILKPVNKDIMGLEEDNGLVFQIVPKNQREDVLMFVENAKTVKKVFESYYKLLEEKA